MTRGLFICPTPERVNLLCTRGDALRMAWRLLRMTWWCWRRREPMAMLIGAPDTRLAVVVMTPEATRHLHQTGGPWMVGQAPDVYLQQRPPAQAVET